MGEAPSKRIKGFSITVALTFACMAPSSTQHSSNAALRAPGATCDGVWHWVAVGGTSCLDGTPTGFEYVCFPEVGLSGPLLLYFQAGGGCWTAESCACQNTGSGCNSNFISTDHYDRSYGCDGQAYGQCIAKFAQGYSVGDIGEEAAFNGPTSAFNDLATGSVEWNMVLIPYCTGDVHAGNAQASFSTVDGYQPNFNGYENVTLDLAQLASMFTAPGKVSLWGSSAGGPGADCNLSQVRATWPRAAMSELNDAVAPLSTPFVPGLPAAIRTWGSYHFSRDGSIVADTCPVLASDSTADYSTRLWMHYNHVTFPHVRKAFSDDYADSTIDFFACALGATPDKDGSCASAVAQSMLLALDTAIGKDSPDYRVYYHSWTCHAEREADGNTGSDSKCDYDQLVQNGAHFNDWVRGWAQVPGFDWQTVY